MHAYVVRLKADRELVGVFVVDEPEDLHLLIDECCDAGACEYLTLPPGGLYHSADAPDVPTIYDPDQEATGEKMPDWFAGATMTDHWNEVFTTDGGESGDWRDVLD